MNFNNNFLGEFISDYNCFKGVKLAHQAEKIVKVNITFVINDCAALCSTESSFRCLSFDFCTNRPTQDNYCLLHQVHELNNNVSEKSKLQWNLTNEYCDHYSRNYLADFNSEPGKQIVTKQGDAYQMDKISIDECAKQCRESNCKSFDYCFNLKKNSLGDQRSCVLSSNSNVQTKTNINCTLYSKHNKT